MKTKQELADEITELNTTLKDKQAQLFNLENECWSLREEIAKREFVIKNYDYMNTLVK